MRVFVYVFVCVCVCILFATNVCLGHSLGICMYASGGWDEMCVLCGVNICGVCMCVCVIYGVYMCLYGMWYVRSVRARYVGDFLLPNRERLWQRTALYRKQ